MSEDSAWFNLTVIRVTPFLNGGWHALSLRRAWEAAKSRPSQTQGVPPMKASRTHCFLGLNHPENSFPVLLGGWSSFFAQRLTWRTCLSEKRATIVVIGSSVVPGDND